MAIGDANSSTSPFKPAAPPDDRPSLTTLNSWLDELTKQAEQLTGQTSVLAERLCGAEPSRDTSGAQVSSVPNGVINEIAQKLNRLSVTLHAADYQLQRANAVL